MSCVRPPDDGLARFRGQLYELSGGGDKRCLSERHAPSRRFGSIYQLGQSQSRISLRSRLFLLANSGCSPTALPKRRKPLRDMLLGWDFRTNLNHFLSGRHRLLLEGLAPPDDGWMIVTSKDDPSLKSVDRRQTDKNQRSAVSIGSGVCFLPRQTQAPKRPGPIQCLLAERCVGRCDRRAQTR